MLDVFREAGWRLYQARDRKRALQHLERQPVHVVVTNAHVATWPWKKALEDLRRMARRPQLVVSSRVADESLWAEALNWGAYDVLAEPFERDEVARVIASARRHFDPPARPYAGAQAAAS
jgi:DNA-binding response OmpR family regulator